MTTRTSPEIKWLLVERATIAGDIARREKSIQLLSQEISGLRSKLEALDRTIDFVNSSLNTAAAGVISRHTPEYKKRGALKELISQAIKSAAPGSIGTRTIVDTMIAHFGLNFVTRAERDAFAHNTVGRQIRRLQQEGLVEALHLPGAPRAVWRWKDKTPSFQDVLKLASPD